MDEIMGYLYYFKIFNKPICGKILFKQTTKQGQRQYRLLTEATFS
jgi:hypothetical protein